ncbi:hypothetical protein [Longimicrobium sp.]|uniref:hypothetical protein n=1 Tax=Longimicrobium sp. TaxID=2029185 RepID=UPI002E37A16C|nr:hypothetical protein [Longimicrobium sp.]HEX6036747.1 hypothetical protein [Longimicrobium sp.]
MEKLLESGILVTLLVAVGALYAAVVIWKSFEYLLSEHRRRRDNPPPPDHPDGP